MSEGRTGNTSRPDAATAEVVRASLQAWYGENARDLPWRRTRDPWRILVSEVMLQQIQVKRAIPFYETFLQRFPTVETLAAAPLSEAIKAWGDLGRYRRVVNLHRTARVVVDEHRGEIPRDAAELIKLPGIGPYTAGAVVCFAFEQRAVFVDTNIRRVLHRLFFGPEVPAKKASEREILDVAADLVPAGEASWAWNQAIMELGALVCTARAPRCELCPLARQCRAREEIGPALAGVPRKGRSETVYRYEDSNRFLRGRVLAKLREAPEEGVLLRDLGADLREGSEGSAWILPAVESLERDGLAKVHGRERIHPAVADAVAETLSPYGSERISEGTDERSNGGVNGESAGDLRVTLP